MTRFLEWFRRGEAGARGVVIVVGTGLLAFTVGGLAAEGLAVRIAAHGGIDDPWLGFATGWVLQRLWLWWILPTLGAWLARTTAVAERSLVWGTSLSGEAFGMLLAWATGGPEAVALDPVDGVARVATLLLGVWLVRAGVRDGRARLEEARRAATAPPQVPASRLSLPADERVP